MVEEAIKELDHFRGERSLDWLAKNRNSYLFSIINFFNMLIRY